mmetsp:Transcript_33508/g.51479  ORF Transcript_33508/g.51479 Transcript_33508/m.51479 type:complete len:88 (+) Transcript_33508:1304-1567(+)|eukprot:CAMPEP_0170507118 /NCGR_PEP_ID=MMETSP0208-20121228/57749_1 /TAXON_ID=197538 /ORGANISM="Strombidium inclinatum, Strain S3" /LENGTH=87 /DNA_ID=CAMNT_0010789123 /DNA_START=1285 /DNA_END=1548 /DNA_ORIENTATION=+
MKKRDSLPSPNPWNNASPTKFLGSSGRNQPILHESQPNSKQHLSEYQIKMQILNTDLDYDSPPIEAYELQEEDCALFIASASKEIEE